MRALEWRPRPPQSFRPRRAQATSGGPNKFGRTSSLSLPVLACCCCCCRLLAACFCFCFCCCLLCLLACCAYCACCACLLAAAAPACSCNPTNNVLVCRDSAAAMCAKHQQTAAWLGWTRGAQLQTDRRFSGERAAVRGPPGTQTHHTAADVFCTSRCADFFGSRGGRHRRLSGAGPWSRRLSSPCAAMQWSEWTARQLTTLSLCLSCWFPTHNAPCFVGSRAVCDLGGPQPHCAPVVIPSASTPIAYSCRRNYPSGLQL